MTDSPAIYQLHPGQIFQDRYEILEHIGDGEFGGVYKARHIELGLTVALKLLHPDLLADIETRSRFQREGKILEALSHQNVVRLYEYGISKQLIPFMAMEYLQGTSLSMLLNQSHVLPPAKVIDIAIQVCDALTATHNLSVVHRDLNPKNIVLLNNKECAVKLVDFGLSRVMAASKVSSSQELTKTGLLIGSVRYMSPEQCAGEKADPRADIYALGCIIYEAASGTAPLSADSPIGLLHKHMTEEPAPLPQSASTAEFTEGLNVILANALAKDPKIRYQSANQMAYDFELLRKGKLARIRKRSETYKPTADQFETAVKRRKQLLKILKTAPFLIALLALVIMLYLKLQAPASDLITQLLHR